jgi:predicted CopG family antitoxin
MFVSEIQMVKTIKIAETTHAELTKLGAKNETYDDIIMKLIGYYKDRTGKHENTPFTYDPERKRK